jgi:hypothetical protein
MPPQRHPCPPFWLSGVFPFFRPAALAAGVSVCFPVSISIYQQEIQTHE